MMEWWWDGKIRATSQMSRPRCLPYTAISRTNPFRAFTLSPFPGKGQVVHLGREIHRHVLDRAPHGLVHGRVAAVLHAGQEGDGVDAAVDDLGVVVARRVAVVQDVGSVAAVPVHQRVRLRDVGQLVPDGLLYEERHARGAT